MRKRFPYIATAACAAVCLLLLSGCAHTQPRSLLWYQDSFVSAVLEGEGRRWTLTRLPDGFSARLDAPASAAGVTFTVTSAASYASAEDVTIPVTEAMLGGARRVIGLFSLREEALTGVSAGHESDGDAVLAHYHTESGDITVGIGGDGLPLFFETEDGVRYTVPQMECGAPQTERSTNP